MLNSAAIIREARNNISDLEWRARLELACAYHLSGIYGWTDLIYTHFTARIPDQKDCFLINPFGMHFREVTPSNLIKVDYSGAILCNSNHEINPTGAVIHGSIFAARHDINCAIHLHTANGVAVSSVHDGLLPISQHALHLFGDIAYHEYKGIAVEETEKNAIVNDLANKKVMLLRNHGTLTTGATIPEAFMLMYMLEKAAEIQIKTLSQGLPICTIPKEVCALAHAQALALREKHLKLEWQALLRLLDTPFVKPLLDIA